MPMAKRILLLVHHIACRSRVLRKDWDPLQSIWTEGDPVLVNARA